MKSEQEESCYPPLLVMHEGRITGELSRAEATQEKIMALATGGE